MQMRPKSDELAAPNPRFALGLSAFIAASIRVEIAASSNSYPSDSMRLSSPEAIGLLEYNGFDLEDEDR
jgi:hypothetical protein